MGAFIILVCGVLLFAYIFGISCLAQRFVNKRFTIIGTRTVEFPFSGIQVYLITTLLFCFIIHILLPGNNIIIAFINLLFNLVLLIFFVLDYLVGHTSHQKIRKTIDWQKIANYCGTLLTIALLYGLYLIIYTYCHSCSHQIWQIHATGRLYLTSLLHTILPQPILNHINVLYLYVVPFFVIGFMFNTIKYFYYVMTKRRLHNLFLTCVVAAILSVFCFVVKTNLISFMLITTAILLVIYTQYNNFFAHYKILQAAGLFLVAYFAVPAINLYIWIIIATTFLIIQIVTSSRQTTANVVLFCLLAIIPFAVEVFNNIILHNNTTTSVSKVLWIGVLCVMLLFTYSVFSKSNTIKWVDYIINLNRLFSVISICLLFAIFAFVTSNDFSTTRINLIWAVNSSFVSNFLANIITHSSKTLKLFINFLFFMTMPIIATGAAYLAFLIRSKSHGWFQIMFFYLVVALIVLNPFSMIIWSVLILQFLSITQVATAYGLLWFSLVASALLFIVFVVYYLLNEWLFVRKRDDTLQVSHLKELNTTSNHTNLSTKYEYKIF